MASAALSLPGVDITLTLGDTTFDLRRRALVAATVGAPRWGREGEVMAHVRAAGQAGADLAVARLPPRLIGPAAAVGDVPIAARVSSPEAVGPARSAGAALVLVPAELAAALAGGGPTAVVVDDVGAVAEARRVAQAHRLPLAIDTTRLSPGEALAVESVAIPVGCRMVCTVDVRRTRRVVEATAALLAARRVERGEATPP
jgi:hypothetical protein